MYKHGVRRALLPTLVLGLASCGVTTPSAESSAAILQSPSVGASDATGAATEMCEADPYGCVQIADQDPIVVGTALAITGPQAALGLDSQYGAQVALNLRVEVLGHEIVLLNEDETCSTDGGTASASLLSSRQDIVAVIGTSCSEAAIPAAQILGERGVLLVSPSNTAPSLTDPSAVERFYARTAPNDRRQGNAMAEYACSELGIGTAATVHDGSDRARQLEEAFVHAFEARCGGRVTARKEVTTDQADFEGVLAEIAASSDGAAPELLYYPIAAVEGGLLTKQAAETPGMEDLTMATLQTGVDGRSAGSEFIAAAGPEAEGVLLSAPDLETTSDFYTQTFLPEYTNVSAADEPLSLFHAHAFDAANLILDAVAKVAIEDGGTIFVPRTALRDALLGTSNYQGMTGTLGCDQNGDCASPVIHISQVHDGTAERLWP